MNTIEGGRDFRDSCAIAGIGWTPFTKHSGVTPLALAVEAIVAAVADAGLTMADIDGLATHHVNDSALVHEVGAALGMHDVGWLHEEFGGGSRAPSVVGHAALACHSGMARNVVVYRALNGRSGIRMGGTGSDRTTGASDYEFQRPYGLLSPSQNYALGARMHMNRFGTTAEQLGTVSVQQRANARLNARALMRQPITLEDYFNSRFISDPFRLLDCCLETDGACAVVVTTADRAGHGPRPLVTIRGWTSTLGSDDFGTSDGDLTTTPAALVANRLYSSSGVGPEDVDVAELYDAFTFSVIVQLEDYGFCKKGEGGPMVESGDTCLTGRLPVNTHGGFLSEGYVHGLNHICEAVQQLRGEAGERQVPGAELALSTAQPGYLTGTSSGILLRQA